MRVVVRHPARTEPDGSAVPESVAAFRQGRIEDFVNPLDGTTTPKEQVAAIMVAQALAEFPDCQVSIEHLHDNGDQTSTWKDHPPASSAPPGEEHEQVLSAEQGQEAGQ